MKLNLGCYVKQLEGYTNHDLHVDGVDIRHLPYASAVDVDEIQSHHALEHISWREIGPTLEEWYRVLKPGGTLILTFPDAEATMRGFLADANPRRRLAHWGQILAGSQDEPGMVHRSMLDAGIVRHYLKVAGFAVISVRRNADDHNGPGVYMEAIRT